MARDAVCKLQLKELMKQSEENKLLALLRKTEAYREARKSMSEGLKKPVSIINLNFNNHQSWERAIDNVASQLAKADHLESKRKEWITP